MTLEIKEIRKLLEIIPNINRTVLSRLFANRFKEIYLFKFSDDDLIYFLQNACFLS